MRKVLGIIGSPRKLGNCEIMIKEISRNIPEPHELYLLRLSDFDIKPCRGCYGCLFGKERCVLDDDFNRVVEAIVDADALILAAPTYFLGANASLKRFIDRGLSFYAHARNLWEKPSVGVCIAGIEGKEGHGLLGVENFLRMLLTDNRMNRVLYGALPGEIFLSDRNLETAAALGAALLGPAPEKSGPRCPLCGGDTFRFLGGGKVRCMLCSNAGTVRFASGDPIFTIEGSDHDMFLTLQNALDHRDWLTGMKARFLEQKKSLKSVSVPYLKDGAWIVPERSGPDDAPP